MYRKETTHRPLAGLIFAFVFIFGAIEAAAQSRESGSHGGAPEFRKRGCASRVRIVGSVDAHLLPSAKRATYRFLKAYKQRDIRLIANSMDKSNEISVRDYLTQKFAAIEYRNRLSGMKQICVFEYEDAKRSGYFAVVRGRLEYDHKARKPEEIFFYLKYSKNIFTFTELMFSRYDTFELAELDSKSPSGPTGPIR